MMLKFERAENLLDVLMQYYNFINCRLANELNRDQAIHKASIFPYELSKIFKKAKHFRIQTRLE
jgi:hypothetical protein